MISFQLGNLNSNVYSSSNYSTSLLTLMQNYPMILLQGITDNNVTNTILNNLGTSYSLITNVLKQEKQAIYFDPTIFQVVSQVTDNFLAISPIIVQFQHIESGYLFYVLGMRTKNPTLELPIFFSYYQKLQQHLLFTGDWAQCANYTSTPFTTNSSLVWYITDSQNSFSNGTICTSDRVVSTMDLEYIYTTPSVWNTYVTDLGLKQYLGVHYPIQIALSFPAKPNTPFWIELAVIGGCLVFFLTFMSSMMVCLCLSCRTYESFKSFHHPTDQPLVKVENN